MDYGMILITLSSSEE